MYNSLLAAASLINLHKNYDFVLLLVGRHTIEIHKIDVKNFE